MVNTTQFYKTKVALAVVLSLGLAACGDSEGDAGSTSTSTATTDASAAGFEQVSMPTGSIQGVVLDTNGTPVVGATVSTAGQTTLTDDSGSYLFDDVQVRSVAGADNVTANASAGFLVVIQSPAGYASTATVSVNPEAQVDAANAGTTAIPLTTFVDGFLAQAGTAVIPKLESSVEGFVRSSITGEPIAGATIALDFTGIAASTAAGTVNTPNGNVSLSGETVTVTTGDDGSFMFEGISNDSTFDLSISGYTFVDPAAAAGDTAQTRAAFAGTTAEQVETWVGTLTVTANTSTDSLAPFITSVDSSIGAAGDAENMLEPGFDGTTGIVFNISEAVSQTIDAANVLVWSRTLGAYKTVASVVQTATTLTVTMTDAIAAGEIVEVLFQKNELRDSAGNIFTTVEPTNLVYTTDNTPQTTYAEVVLRGHVVAQVNAAITLAQTFSETPTDAFEDSDGTAIAGINRLNNDATNSSLRLANRLDAEDDGVVDSIPVVNGTTATIAIAQTEGVSYTLTVPAAASVTTSGGAAIGTTPNSAGTLLTTAAISSTSVVVNGITLSATNPANQTVTVTPLDDFANPGTAQSIVLIDNVPATTALQESYGLGEVAPLIFGGSVTTVADGGENSIAGTAGTAGDPLIYVTPRLLAGSDANWSSDILAGDQVFDGLGGLPTAETLSNAVAPQAITGEAYTAAQWATFVAAPVAATFGVSFTEAVTLTGAPAWTGTSTLTNFLSAADTISSNDTNTVLVNSNFVGLTVTTNDVLTLGNVDANDSAANSINFTDTIADVATNNSGVNSKARVAFVDALPPFVVSATLTVPSFTVTFNEDIDDTDWETEVLAMTLQDDAGAATSLSTAGFVTTDLSISTDGTTVTFDNSELSTGQFTSLIALFSNGALETVLDNSEVDDSYDFNEGSTLRGHARLDFSGVTDAVADGNLVVGQQTNSWDAYTGSAYDFELDALNMPSAPLFMAWSEIPEFDATLNLVSGANTDTVFTITLTTGNGLAFDLDASFDQTAGALVNVTNANVATAPLALTGTQVDDLLNVTTSGGGAIVTASSSGLIAEGGTAISFSVTFSAALATNDQILFDNASLENPNQVTDTLGRLDPVQAVVVPLS